MLGSFEVLRSRVSSPANPVTGPMSWVEAEERLGGRFTPDLVAIAETYGSGRMCPDLWIEDPRAPAFYRNADLWPVWPPGADAPVTPGVDTDERVVAGTVLVPVAVGPSGESAFAPLADGRLDDDVLWVASQRDADGRDDWIAVEGPLSRLLCSLIDHTEPEIVSKHGGYWLLNPVFFPSGEVGDVARLMDLPSGHPVATVTAAELRSWLSTGEEEMERNVRSWAEFERDSGLRFSDGLREFFETFGSAVVSGLRWWDPREDGYESLLERLTAEFPSRGSATDDVPLLPLALAHREFDTQGDQLACATVAEGSVDDSFLWLTDTVEGTWARFDADFVTLIHEALTRRDRCLGRTTRRHWPWENDKLFPALPVEDP